MAKVGNPGCEGSLDGVLELEISGGIGPYAVLWDSGQTGNRIEELPYGEFAYTVTDSNGCVLTGTAMVNQARPEVRMPTGFDPRDGAYQPVSNCSVSYQLTIWDRWGGMIYFGTEGWNGLIDGVAALLIPMLISFGTRIYWKEKKQVHKAGELSH
ncbi:SprB repeat-containing protein [Algoriphagus boritolerans]|uniref:SprB repeat-containing protein n=1 Tax=Algoriphagus boritolerans TaxID=308111 RepID=UPI000AB61604